MYGTSGHNAHFAKLRKDREDKKEVNGKFKYFLRMQEAKAAKELQWERNNICPKCFIVKTVTGKCSMGCS